MRSAVGARPTLPSALNKLRIYGYTTQGPRTTSALTLEHASSLCPARHFVLVMRAARSQRRDLTLHSSSDAGVASNFGTTRETKANIVISAGLALKPSDGGTSCRAQPSAYTGPRVRTQSTLITYVPPRSFFQAIVGLFSRSSVNEHLRCDSRLVGDRIQGAKILSHIFTKPLVYSPVKDR